MSLPNVSPYLEKTKFKSTKKSTRTKLPHVTRPISREAKTKAAHDYESEIEHLRKLLREYEDSNVNLKAENSTLRMKLEAVYSQDNDATYQLNQFRLKLKTAENQIVGMKDRIYGVDKSEALVKYWQKQNYDREEELKVTTARFEGLIFQKNKELALKDDEIRKMNEDLDFANEKIANLTDTLTKAEDKVQRLEKDNTKLAKDMQDLRTACQEQMLAMRKKCAKDLKIADLKAKKFLKKVAKFSEKKMNELKQNCDTVLSGQIQRTTKLKIKTDTWYMNRINQLIELIDKLKKEASHTYARITAAEDLKQAEIDIDNLEKALQQEQEEHISDNIKNEKIIAEKEHIIKLREQRIRDLELEVKHTIQAAKESHERSAAEIMDLTDKYTEKCTQYDEMSEVLRLVRKKAKEDAEIARYEIKIRDLEILRLGNVIEDLRVELKKRFAEIKDLKLNLKDSQEENERRHHIILSKIKEIGRLEEVIEQVAEKARSDATKAAAILVYTRKVLKETQGQVKRLKVALENAIDFGRQQTKKLNLSLAVIKQKDKTIYKKEVQIVNLEHDVKDGIEENLNLEWKLNKRKQLDADKSKTIDKQRVEIQELRSALESIERKIRTNNAKVTRMRAHVRSVDDRMLRMSLELEQKMKEYGDFKIKAHDIQEAIKDKARVTERRLRETIKLKDEEFEEFQKMHKQEMEANDLRELQLHDKLDTAIRKRNNANERRRYVEAENSKLMERLRTAEAEAHAFKLQRLRIEQAEALAKLGKYVGLEQREQTLDKLQRRLTETRDYLERERALTRETVQELAMRNSTLMLQVKKLASSLKGARTEQAELLSNQLMDVSNFSNHLINKLDESVLLELKQRNRLPPVSNRRPSSPPFGAAGTATPTKARNPPQLEDDISRKRSTESKRKAAMEKLMETSPYTFEIPRVKYGTRADSPIMKVESKSEPGPSSKGGSEPRPSSKGGSEPRPSSKGGLEAGESREILGSFGSDDDESAMGDGKQLEQVLSQQGGKSDETMEGMIDNVKAEGKAGTSPELPPNETFVVES